MSSHREAPEISKDPVADNTDTYAFVSPDEPDTVTIITNYIPLEDPVRRPELLRVRRRRAVPHPHRQRRRRRPDIIYEFRFKTKVRNPNTFLYNTGPITSLDSPNFNRRQFYSVTESQERERHACSATTWPARRATSGRRRRRTTQRWPTQAIHFVADGTPCSPANGSTASSSTSARSSTSADLRPFQNLHLIPMPARRRA